MLVEDRAGATAVVTLERPPANTWTAEDLRALHDRVAALDADTGVDSLVVTGAGERFFCAGDDLNAFADGNPDTAREMAGLLGRAFERLAAFRGLTLAAINGYCLGGGLEWALACDLRVCEAHAVLGLPEARVGLLPCGGGTQRLPRLVGPAWAKRVMLCGEQLDADTARRIGLVEEVVATGDAAERACALAAQARRQSPAARAHCKTLIDAAVGPLASGLLDERERFVNLFGTPDPIEGVAAFLDKREPQWRGDR